jgi:AcrR family transcriptional regulator
MSEARPDEADEGVARPEPDEGVARPEPALSARAARTREAVVDALLALLEEGNLRPTAREVADNAEVSLRSVYVHFDDVEALFLAAAIRHQERMQEIRGDLVVVGSFEERLEAFVERRSRSFEYDANVRRAAVLQEPFSPALRDVLTLGRSILHSQVDDVFADELAEPDSEQGAFQRRAIILATTPAAWDDLRLRQKLGVDEAKDVLRNLVRTILESSQQKGT